MDIFSVYDILHQRVPIFTVDATLHFFISKIGLASYLKKLLNKFECKINIFCSAICIYKYIS